MNRILVTGASGFIGSHCILNLLSHDYKVRGSIRDLDRADSLRQMFEKQGADITSLEFVKADLNDRDSWTDAAGNCTTIFHVASPVPTIQPKDPTELLKSAKEGTLNVLEAASKNSISRVVLTSSISAVLGSAPENRLYTADDWSDPDAPFIVPYARSKTLAERAAWDFCTANDIELTTIAPAVVLGPALETDYGSSLEALAKLMRREVPMLPRFGFGIVDVRDVADLHRLAFENKEAIGQRYIASSDFLWFREIAEIVQNEFPDYRIPQREMPNWLTRIVGFFVKEIGTFVSDLDLVKQLDNEPAKRIGWKPRSPEEAIVSGARSLDELGLV
ncbi:MAG: aldehyde reductase [Gammaproteobacteria bacterium]|nr:aldehyde reductase [Gammaproteobacteria bacterium]